MINFYPKQSPLSCWKPVRLKVEEYQRKRRIETEQNLVGSSQIQKSSQEPHLFVGKRLQLTLSSLGSTGQFQTMTNRVNENVETKEKPASKSVAIKQSPPSSSRDAKQFILEFFLQELRPAPTWRWGTACWMKFLKHCLVTSPQAKEKKNHIPHRPHPKFCL